MKLTRIVVSILPFTLLSACGVSSQGSESPAQTISQSASSSTLTSSSTSARDNTTEEGPLFLGEAFGYSARDTYLITLAQATLISECMEERGSPQPLVGVSDFASDSQYYARLRYRLLMDDSDRVRTSGYAWPVNQPVAPEFVGDPAQLDDLLNNPTSGCRTKAVQALGQGERILSNVDRTLAESEGAEISEITTGPSFAAMRAAWTKCMAAAGFPDRGFMTGTSRAGIETAIADSDCRASTGFRSAIIEFLIKTRSEYSAANAAKVTALLNARALEVSKATAILSERGISTTPPT